MQILMNDEAGPDQPGIAQHHREQPDDAFDAWLVDELDFETGEIDLRLLAGRRLEANFESGAGCWSKIAHAISHRAIAAGKAALLDLPPKPHGG